MTTQLTAVLMREDGGYVALCPELDVVSEGATIDEARANLIEAAQALLESASEEEIRERLHSEVLVTRIEVVSA
jgi:predicted RNase H-like HicB family nuclease